jgi:hypothetical protein
MTIITNHHARPLIDAFQLTENERQEFDYIDWPSIDNGSGSATFFRYRGELYDLSQFTVLSATDGWDAGSGDSYFSATLIRLPKDEWGDTDPYHIIVGRMYW